VFIITIEAETASEARAKLLDLARVIGGPVEPTQAAVVGHATKDATAAGGETAHKGKAVAGTEATLAAPAASTTETPAAPSEPPLDADEPKLKPEELRAKIRATLAPVSETKPAEIKALIAKYGGSVSKIKDDSLAVVLELAEQLAAS